MNLPFIDIPNLLKLRRKIIGCRQMEIAEAIGYRNKSFISLIENGEVQMPLHKIGDIADAYRFQSPGDFMKLALCQLHPDTFATFTPFLVRGYGFPEGDLRKDLEKAALSVMIDCGLDPREGAFLDAPRKVMLTVRELHCLGFERLRLISEMDPSGNFWRWAIIPAECVSRENGARAMGSVTGYPHGSVCEGQLAIGIGDQPDDAPEAIAQLLIRKYPDVEKEAKGPDPEYMRWF